jgi:hypothetical protein
MTPDRLLEILDAYGADPRRWPAAERTDAEALLARSVEARRAQDEARRLDRLLASVPAPAAPPLDTALLAARVIANAQRAAPGAAFDAMLGVAGLRRRAAAGFAVAAALAGFMVGWGLPAVESADDEFAGLLPAPIMEVETSW